MLKHLKAEYYMLQGGVIKALAGELISFLKCNSAFLSEGNFFSPVEESFITEIIMLGDSIHV